MPAKNKYYYLLLKALLLFLSIYTLRPVHWPEVPIGKFGHERLLVKAVSITGPQYEIIKGAVDLRKLLSLPGRSIHSNGIELSGKSPEEIIPYPYIYKSEFILYGKILGISKKYTDTGHGLIPIYEVSKIKLANYLPAILFSGLPDLLIVSAFIISLLFIIYYIFRILTYLARKYREKV